MQKAQIMDKQTIETLLPKSFLKVHQLIKKILSDNYLLPNEEESKIDESMLRMTVKTVMKIQ